MDHNNNAFSDKGLNTVHQVCQNVALPQCLSHPSTDQFEDYHLFYVSINQVTSHERISKLCRQQVSRPQLDL